MYTIVRSDKEIDDLMNKVMDAKDTGHNPFFGMTYADGIYEAISWLTEEGLDNPWEE